MMRKELVKKRIAAVSTGIDGGGRIFGERDRAGARKENEGGNAAYERAGVLS